MNTIQQGRVGEASILAEFVRQGYDVFLPQFGNTNCDMIVVKDGLVYRVECKSTAAQTPSGKYTASLRQIRPNRSGNTVKKFDATKADLLAIYVVPEDRVEILDAKCYHDKSSVAV